MGNDLEKMFNATSAAVLVLNEDGDIVWSNAAFCRSFGYTLALLQSSDSWPFLAVTHQEKFLLAIRRALSGDAPEPFNMPVISSDATIQNVRWSTLLIDDAPGGKAVAVVGLKIADGMPELRERNLMAEELRRSEERYQSVLDDIDEGYFEIDLAGDFTFVNDAECRDLGYSREELIGMNYRVYSDEETARELKKLFHHIFLTGQPVKGYAGRFISNDGRRHFNELFAALIRDEQGKPTGFRGIARDITERKETERILRDKEAQLRGIVSGISGLVFQFYATDAGKFGVSYISDGLTGIMGELPADLEALFPYFITQAHEEDRTRIMASIEQAVKTQSPWVFEGRFFKSTGEMIWCRGLSTPRREDDRLVFDGILLDVTEQRRTEEALHLFKDLVERSTDAIGMSTPEGKHYYQNQAFSELFGDVGENPRETLYVDKDVADQIFSAILSGGSWRGEVRMFGKDKRVLDIFVRAYALLNPDGHLVMLVGQHTDMSERKRAEEERRNLQEQLLGAQKLEAVGRLAGGLAHDFNNILTGIQGSVALLLLDVRPDHPHYTKLKRIEDHIKRGANLTRQLLGFARGGKYEVKAFSINDLIRKISSIFLETHKEIEADFQLSGDLHPVEADSGQIEQALLNVLINAGHAMPRGGHLHIETVNLTIANSDAKAFEVEPGRFVKISISDNGCGMDKETLKRIFDPFFTTKAQEGGSGLGLASAYGILRSHGGIINAYSEPGQGSTFNIYLPSSAKKAQSEEHLQDKGLQTGSGGILLVDDESAIQETASEMLRALGYTVYQAASGQEALAVYMEKKKHIDLVILDMILPGIGGGQVLKMLQEVNPDVKVILSSGYSMQGEVKKVMDAGCLGFIQKPYRYAELSEMVHQVLHFGKT